MMACCCEFGSNPLPNNRTVHLTFASESRMRAKRVLAALPVPSTSSVIELAAFVRRMRCTYNEKNKNKNLFFGQIRVITYYLHCDTHSFIN